MEEDSLALETVQKLKNKIFLYIETNLRKNSQDFERNSPKFGEPVSAANRQKKKERHWKHNDKFVKEAKEIRSDKTWNEKFI